MSVRERVFVACAIGGGFGAFLAHQLFYPSGWSILIGFLAGGLVSYLTYDFKQFVTAIPQAWVKTVGGIREHGTWGVLFMLAVVSFLSFIPLIVSGLRVMNLSAKDADSLAGFLIIMWAVGLLTVLLRHVADGTDMKDHREACIFIIKWFNPITVLLVGVPYFIFVTVKYAVLFLPRFFWNLFVIIHSELRLLCLFDGGLGAVAGTLIAGTLAGTIFGALVGGVFGVLNYEIVSKRILKLVLAR